MDNSVKINVEGQILAFQYNAGESKEVSHDHWHTKLQIHTEKVDFEVHSECYDTVRSVTRAIHWGEISLFIKHYKSIHSKQIAKAVKCLYFLCKEIGFWKEVELEAGVFTCDGIVLNIGSSTIVTQRQKQFDEYTYELLFNLTGSESNYYIDTYGLWIASFKGNYLQGVKREQY